MGINRTDSFVTWTKVHLGLVTGYKSFHYSCHLLGEYPGAREVFLSPYLGKTNRDLEVTAVSSAGHSQATGRDWLLPCWWFQDMLWVSLSHGHPIQTSIQP